MSVLRRLLRSNCLAPASRTASPLALVGGWGVGGIFSKVSVLVYLTLFILVFASVFTSVLKSVFASVSTSQVC